MQALESKVIEFKDLLKSNNPDLAYPFARYVKPPDIQSYGPDTKKLEQVVNEYGDSELINKFQQDVNGIDREVYLFSS